MEAIRLARPGLWSLYGTLYGVLATASATEAAVIHVFIIIVMIEH